MTTPIPIATMTDVLAALFWVAILVKLVVKKECEKYKLSAFEGVIADDPDIETASDNTGDESAAVEFPSGSSSESRYNCQIVNPHWRADTTPATCVSSSDDSLDPLRLTFGIFPQLDDHCEDLTAVLSGFSLLSTSRSDAEMATTLETDSLRRRPP
uniref:Secreted protein n=1 Tax=Panagrellus redivivus TaxID=6233 RepID=A0A7E4W613_PANRE